MKGVSSDDLIFSSLTGKRIRSMSICEVYSWPSLSTLSTLLLFDFPVTRAAALESLRWSSFLRRRSRSFLSRVSGKICGWPHVSFSLVDSVIVPVEVG